jgi:predicted O-methyltransferase YrrM
VDEALWTQVDEYIERQIVGETEDLSRAVENSDRHELPHIQVSVAQGKMLYLLGKLVGARRILEIGTLGGYSTIWLARSLPAEGSLVSLEVDERHAGVARQNLDTAGVLDRVEVRVGPAIQTLPVLENEGGPAFDLFFIDADKQSNADYFSWAVRLGRPGSLIIVDNVVRGGGVVDDKSDDAAIQGTRRLYEAIAAEPRVEATAIQTVGTKGYDGFVIARVRTDEPAA